MSNKDILHFILRKLHSLTGLVPFGAFILFHMYLNAFVLAKDGAKKFNDITTPLSELPLFDYIEIGLLFGLVFHAIYGLVITLGAGQNVSRYKFYRNWAYTIQRWSGALAIIFLGYHVYVLRFVHKASETNINFIKILQTHINWSANPIITILYIVGVTACVYHFTNGIWNFLINWGITAGQRAQKVSAYCCGLLFFALMFVWANIIIFYLSL